MPDIDQDDTDVGNFEVSDPEWEKLDLDPDVKVDYEKSFDYNKPFFKRVKHFITAESKAGRKAKIIKDLALAFVPYGRTISTTTEMATEILSDNQTTNTMNKSFLQRITSLKNFINVRDEDGNVSPQEIFASVIQIVLAGGIVYGAQELGVWDGLSNLLGL